MVLGFVEIFQDSVQIPFGCLFAPHLEISKQNVKNVLREPKHKLKGFEAQVRHLEIPKNMSIDVLQCLVK